MQPDTEPFAMITLLVSDGDHPESTGHGRVWEIPHGTAEFFAEAMTERFGQPRNEVLGALGIYVKAAELAAADGMVNLEP